MLEGLGKGGLAIGPGDGVTVLVEGLSGLDGRVGGIVGERDVGELGVVGRGRGAGRIPGLETIRVHMVAGVLRDGVGKVPGMGQGEIVRGVSETNRVLIEQSGEGDGIGGRDSKRRGEDAGKGSIVRPLNTVFARVELTERDGDQKRNDRR